MKNLKISVITVCFNSAKTIAKTIESVKAQKYKYIEHIFIDGKSTDGTLDIIRRLSPESVIVSEKDKGIYDAMNKGYKLATGDIVGTLNSDDYYADENVAEKINSCFQEEAVKYICGRIKFIDPATGKLSHYFGAEPSLESNLRYMTIAHPTIYVRKELIEKVGYYSLDYKIAADFDWCLRLLKGGYAYKYIKEPIVCMSWGGQSSKNHILSAKEELVIKIKYFPQNKAKFAAQYYFYSAMRFIRSSMTKLKLGKLVNIARHMQGKME